MESFWSLLRSWLRPHRAIIQEKLPLYLGFFEFVHNVRRRGRDLLDSLVGIFCNLRYVLKTQYEPKLNSSGPEVVIPTYSNSFSEAFVRS